MTHQNHAPHFPDSEALSERPDVNFSAASWAIDELLAKSRVTGYDLNSA